MKPETKDGIKDIPKDIIAYKKIAWIEVIPEYVLKEIVQNERNKWIQKEQEYKPPKICSCGCFDIDHDLSQVYGFYHCINCKKTCSSSDFKELPKDRFGEWKEKFDKLKKEGVLA
jgi:hypothetical protein